MFCIAYRYDPAKCRNLEGPVANGAIVTDEFETHAEAERAVADLLADPRIQWAEHTGDQSPAHVSYGA